MSRTTIRKRLAARIAVLAATAAAALTVTSGALAVPYTTYGNGYTTCTPYAGSSVMRADPWIFAADRYYAVENQTVYMQAELYSYSAGRTIVTSPWFYAYAYDSVSPSQWRRLSDGVTLSPAFTGVPRGTYRIGLRFAWDGNAWGATSGRSNLIWAPNSCTFAY